MKEKKKKTGEKVWRVDFFVKIGKGRRKKKKELEDGKIKPFIYFYF